MILRSFKYNEFPDQPQAWQVEHFTLNGINLLVGRNASGKTRILNVLNSLANFIRRGSIVLWNSGHWDLQLSEGADKFDLVIEIERGKVASEKLLVNNDLRLERASDGSGKIWFEKNQCMIDFKMPDDVLALVARRDELQHSFLEPIHTWASCLRSYQFSSDLGKQTINLLNEQAEAVPDSQGDTPITSVLDPNAVVAQYHAAFERYGAHFDEAVLADFEEIGYPCNSIEEAFTNQFPFVNGQLPTILQVQEKGLLSPTRQFEMSTGMFRALAMLIHLNFAVMSDIKATVLIDDIGEGLDFERSIALIRVLIDRCKDSSVQIVMTSNDRFVMNEVNLQYWHVVDRIGGRVSIFDHENAKKEFEEFKYMGLSNFDFFSSKAYRGSEN